MKRNVCKACVAVVTTFGALVMLAAEAWGQTSNDPTAGAAETMLTEMKTWIVGHAVPLIVGLVAVGVIIGLLVRYARRTALFNKYGGDGRGGNWGV